MSANNGISLFPIKESVGLDRQQLFFSRLKKQQRNHLRPFAPILPQRYYRHFLKIMKLFNFVDCLINSPEQ